MCGKETVIELFPRQQEFVKAVFSCKYTRLLYGGAIRGGKTYVILAILYILCRVYPGSRWAIVRRDLPTIKRNLLPSFNKTKPRFVGDVNKSDWTARCKNGSEIVFFAESFKDDPDLNRLKGFEGNGFFLEECNELNVKTYVKCVERAGSWTCRGEQPPPLVIMTCNPANNYVKSKFYDPHKNGTLEAPYFFLQARIYDNPHLPKSYLDSLEELKESEPDHYARFVDGDWEAGSSNALEMWRPEKHVIEPFVVPDHWLKFRSFDWGSSKPFSVGWWAVADGSAVKTILGGVVEIPEGALVRYREWYGWNGRADEGLRLTSQEVARGILEQEDPGEEIAYSCGDPAIFNKFDGPSVSERMADEGVYFEQIRGAAALNPRKAGFQEVRLRMKGKNGVPMLYVFSTCNDGFIRTVPSLELDPHRPEDVDTTQEDHAYDETRYACMSRPWVADDDKPKKSRDNYRHYGTVAGDQEDWQAQ